MLQSKLFVNYFLAKHVCVLHDYQRYYIYILNIDFSDKIAPCLGPYKAYLPIIFSFHN